MGKSMRNELEVGVEDAALRRRPPRISISGYLAKLKLRRQSVEGYEIPDGTPEAPPVGFIKQPSMVDNLRAMVKSELLRREAVAAGAETFEEADDFEVEDDPVPMSGYENDPEFEPSIPANERDGVPVPPGGNGEGAEGGLSKGDKPAGEAPPGSDPPKAGTPAAKPVMP